MKRCFNLQGISAKALVEGTAAQSSCDSLLGCPLLYLMQNLAAGVISILAPGSSLLVSRTPTNGHWLCWSVSLSVSLQWEKLRPTDKMQKRRVRQQSPPIQNVFCARLFFYTSPRSQCEPLCRMGTTLQLLSAPSKKEFPLAVINESHRCKSLEEQISFYLGNWYPFNAADRG